MSSLTWGAQTNSCFLLKKFKYWINSKKTDFIFLIIRTTTRCTSSTRVHPEDVCRPESRQWQNYLLPLHVRYRHREYPLRLCCCQGHNPTVKPEGVQPGLTVPRRPSKTNLAWLKIHKRDCIICENNLHNTNLLPAWTLWMSTEFVVNIMMLFKLYGGKPKDAEVHSQHISSFFRQNLVTQCVLNSQPHIFKI